MLKSFVVVIPSYNNARWCRLNLESILTQEHPRFRVVYVDDASTDDTFALATTCAEKSGLAHRITLVRNESRLGAVANIDSVVRACDPGEIVVLVDGDDFLAHPRVLTRLNATYRDPNVWVTWGQFARFPHGSEGFCAPIPHEIESANAYRDYVFVSSHLRTFYAGLYQRIRLDDLQDVDGQFFTTGGDVGAMFALLEMAGPRARFLPDVLYQYNRANPLNDDKVDRGAQVRAEMKIRGKARYGRLPGHANPAKGGAPHEVCIGTGLGRSFFDSPGELFELDHGRRPFRQMRAVLNRLGYTVRESQTLADLENPHRIVVFDLRPEELDRIAKYPPERVSLVSWQDPVSAPFNLDRRLHEPFGRIYTWHDDLVDNVRYHKLHFPVLRPMLEDVVPLDSRKFATLLASPRPPAADGELCAEELATARVLADAEPEAFDVFGWGLDEATTPNLRGGILNKVDQLRRYRFSICYETVSGWNGYITSRLFESFAAGCVPVYRGAPNVTAWIPTDCFIARDEFDSEADLCAFLREMPEATHAAYLDRIQAFLSSERAVPYSAAYFVRMFVDLVGGRADARAADSSASGDGADGCAA